MALIKDIFIDPAYHLPMVALANANRSIDLVNNDLFCGVELELEGCLHPLPSHGGTPLVGPYAIEHGILAHADGSLRNGGIELVTKPVRGKALVEQVEYICSLAQQAQWKPSNRAGLHVHVNVQGLTPAQWANLIKAYVLVEPCFFRAIGQERKGSIYCKSWYQYGIADELRFSINRIQQGSFNNLNTRYLGLNINSTGKYGTLEFRHMNSTVDAGAIIKWINTIALWYNYGLGAELTPDVVRTLKPEGIVEAVFGDLALMDHEFPSYFYHACIPLWFDLFGGQVKEQSTRSWSRERQRAHKGYESYMAKRKTRAQAAPAPDLPPIEDEFVMPSALPWFGLLINDNISRVYTARPEHKPQYNRKPTQSTFYTDHTNERLWLLDDAGRSDLYWSPATVEELTAHGSTRVYTYAHNIPENT